MGFYTLKDNFTTLKIYKKISLNVYTSEFQDGSTKNNEQQVIYLDTESKC